MASFDSLTSSITVPSITCNDDFYDFSDLEPISISYFSHHGEMPVISITADTPVVCPEVLKPTRQSIGCRYA